MANSVSSDAHVTGIDISESIVSLANENTKDINNVDFILADAETYQFGETKFDGVISRFGVMFFSDPTKAFTNIHSAMKEHAFLTFICWPSRQENKYFYDMTEAVLKHTGKEVRPLLYYTFTKRWFSDAMNFANLPSLHEADEKMSEHSNKG